MAELTADNPEASGLLLRALQQAGRELLLAQASDWAFMLDSGQMAGYASRRVRGHLANFQRLREAIVGENIDPHWLAGLESRDNLFPQLEPRFFGA